MARFSRTALACRAVAVLLAASCDLVSSGPADGGAGDSGADDRSRALVFEFETRPELPGRAGGDYDAHVESAVFALREIRAVGDASPGGDETKRAELTLSWPTGPDELVFSAAPPGLYAHLLFEVAAYRLEGTVTPGDAQEPFVLDDAPPSGIAIALELEKVEHAGDETTEVEIEIRLRRLVDAVAWELVDGEGGVLRVDASSGQIAGVRERVPGAFEVDD